MHAYSLVCSTTDVVDGVTRHSRGRSLLDKMGIKQRAVVGGTYSVHLRNPSVDDGNRPSSATQPL
jgi:hypothetical protein